MRIRYLAVLVAVLLLAGACGGDKKSTSASDTSATAAPAGGTESAAPAGGEGTQASAAPGSTASTATAKPADGGAAVAPTTKPGTPAPVKQAKPGEVNEPAIGKYVYHTTGTATSPFSTPPNQPQNVDRETTHEFTAKNSTDKGTEYTQGGGNQQGSQSTTYRWEATRILLVRTKISTPQGSIDCQYSTPEGGLLLAPIPIKAGTLPKQEWKNDQCEGTHELTIVGQEEVTDETGKTWKVWRAQAKTVAKFGVQFDAAIDQTVWYSADLGWQVKSHQVTDAHFQGAQIKSDTTSVLKSHP